MAMGKSLGTQGKSTDCVGIRGIMSRATNRITCEAVAPTIRKREVWVWEIQFEKVEVELEAAS
jgi:hypothetical protein